MASIFKPTYTRRNPKTGGNVQKNLRKWYVEYVDGDGIRRRVPGYVDKEATRQYAAQLEKRAALEATGVVDRYADPRRRPLLEHLEDYRRFLESKANTEKHIRITVSRVRSALEACAFKFINDLDANRLAEWLKNERASGLSARTSNFYLTCAKGFLRWLQMSRRIPDNPLAHLQGVNPRVDVRRQRRALTPEELGRLFEATRGASPFRRVSGADRALLYLVASYTGLRASELASLRADSFDLESRLPTLTVEAIHSKHRRKDVLPLHPYLVGELGLWLKGRKGADKRLWPGSWLERSGRMIRQDLERAGIPYETPAGVADLHALRHTFLSNLARSGAHPKAIQELARHSTVTLTLDRYSHLGLVDLSGALEGLPSPPAKKNEPAVLHQATGTEPLHAGQYAENLYMQGQHVSSPVKVAGLEGASQLCSNSKKKKELATHDKPKHAETMVSPAWLEHATCGLGNGRIWSSQGRWSVTR